VVVLVVLVWMAVCVPFGVFTTVLCMTLWFATWADRPAGTFVFVTVRVWRTT
jgi:hypothetical protein